METQLRLIPRHGRCRSSEVEHSLGKGEVESSRQHHVISFYCLKLMAWVDLVHAGPFGILRFPSLPASA